MAYTLADKAQAMGDYERGIVKVIYEDMAGGYNNLLSVCPILDVDKTEGTDLTMEDEGPAGTGYASRPIGGAYPESTGGLKQRGWILGNVGGRVSIDNVYLRQKGYADGANPLDLNVMQLTRRINRAVNAAIVTGDRAVNPLFMNGFKKYCPSDNWLDIATISSGAATSGLDITNTAGASLAANQKALIEAVDYLLDLVGGRTHPDVYLVCNYQVQMGIRKAIKEQGWFGIEKAYFDNTVTEFGGVKFLTPGAKSAVTTFTKAVNDTNSIIPNNMAYGASGTKTTEIYAVRFGAERGFHLKQLRGGLQTRDIGLMEHAPIRAKEIEWWLGGYCPVDDAVAKLYGVKAVA